ncbi:MAG: Methylisocitrate lyase [Firmicutes bacterium ADurb.Bin248]|nr:MAG: Methylisocitrate lyase [Firmicutes bacterium ADurb.Bin248]HOG02073.1 isocitrate lyase/phosphoenolpyruvate mutase family protein [Clostridia bacterium]HPK15871.1 isocitrate lyase/phosphoenolpyruvate mutase family protein [Clostridia bacterium]
MKYKSFREQLASEQVFAACVFDCMSVKAAELCGYNGLMLSGGLTARSMSGYPDLGIMSLDELEWISNRITDITSLPLVVDAENGTLWSISLTVRLLTARLNEFLRMDFAENL